MRLVPIDAVSEGSYLAKTIYDNNGRVLLRQGVMLTESLIKKIKSIDIYSMYIQDEYSSDIIEDVIKPELRQKAIKAVKDTFQNFEKQVLDSTRNVSSQKQKDLIKQKQQYFQTMGQVAENIVEEILGQKNAIINIVDIKNMDNYTYQHSVNVAILSLVIGMQLQLSRQELHQLCLGALLHDVGKVLLPREIVQKYENVTPEEFELVKQHASKGYEYLKHSQDIPAASRMIVLQHHERVSGNGYPERRKGEQINNLAKVVAVADSYDKITSDRPSRRGISPNEAVEYIMASGGSLFDYETVKAFTKVVVPYPAGTLIRLSNGELAVVEETNPLYPLRPVVKIVKSSGPSRILNKLNLTMELNLVIEGVQYKI
jgi:HD-GYP domain-containing protein (c-di-GMP phosphodiesterase class II)